ncbi:MAG: hypothetical protein AB1896_22800, partial [Thermodesulfobacteriota bacterium]
KRFAYEISLHPAEEFRQVAYFCGEDGACNLEEVPADQVNRLAGILDRRGREGWELVQLSFGRGGLMAFWKREISEA